MNKFCQRVITICVIIITIVSVLSYKKIDLSYEKINLSYDRINTIVETDYYSDMGLRGVLDNLDLNVIHISDAIRDAYGMPR